MGFMNRFSRKNELEAEVKILEPIDERRQELVAVKVRDIKEYLLEEYDRSRGLVEQIDELNKKLFEMETTKTKYNAALVTLDEYKMRLNSYKERFSDYESKYEEAKEETDRIKDELNDYKIRFQRAAITKEEIEEEVVKAVQNSIIEGLKNHKGNLSKEKAIEIVRKGGEEFGNQDCESETVQFNV